MAEVTALPDAGPCDWCGDAQWDHKRGKAGCKALGCPCGQYEPPKVRPAPAVAVRRTAATCAYPNGEDAGEHDHAMCEDVVAERDELTGVVVDGPASPGPAERLGEPEPARPGDVELPPPCDDWPLPAAEVEDAEAVGLVVRAESPANEAGVPVSFEDAVAVEPPEAQASIVLSRAEAEQMYAELERRRADEEQIRQLTADRDRLASRLDIIRKERRREHLAHQVAILTAELEQVRRERDAAVVQRDQAYERVDELDGELGQVRGALDADVDDDLVVVCGRLRTELGRANARAQGAKTRLDKAIVAGTEAATRVLWRYDAEQCLDCGSRFTTWVDHEHPLTPVTVLVVAREVAGA